VVLVILIALWAMVLLPPYLKDRRASGRTFRSGQSAGMGGIGGRSGYSGVNSAQRFLPLQQASGRYSTSSVSSPTGMRSSGVSTFGSGHVPPASRVSPAPTTISGNPAGNPAGNVVQLRPVEDSGDHGVRAPLATSAAAYLEETPMTEDALLQQALGVDGPARFGMPHSTAAARERRRHVLLALTGVAVFTLLLALSVGGRWIAAHVLVDAAMVGYVILLVRHRQLMADRLMKVEPIRPPVSEQPPATVQLAPSYLLDSKTGS